ncbi:hypothetical protein [Enterococcus sp. C76]
MKKIISREKKIIMFIAVENIPQAVKTSKSRRVSIESVLTKIQ